MQDGVALGVALLVCVLPGLAVLVALGVRPPLLLTALAAPVSVAVAGLTGTVTGLLGLPYGAGALGVVTVVAAFLAGRRMVGARRRERPDPATVWTSGTARPPGARRPPVAVEAGQGLGLGLAALGVIVAVATWLRGIGPLATVPQEHDTVVHLLLVAYIGRTGRAAPWELLPVDVATGEPVYFYPAGMHLLAAAAGDLAGGAVVGLNAVTVVLLAVALPVSAAVLAAVAARRLGLGPVPVALTGGVASLVAAGLYRPAFQLTHDGGLLPNAAALALTPAVVAALLLLPGASAERSSASSANGRLPARLRASLTGALSRRSAVAVGLGCAGIVWLHPSAAVSVGVTVVVWWLADAAVTGGRELRALAVPLTVTAVTATVLLVPMLLAAAAAAARTSAFPADTAATGAGEAIGATIGLAYGGYLDPAWHRAQLLAATLAALGICAVLMLRRGLGPVAAWGAWVGITVAYLLSPDSGPETIVTGPLYKALLRIWSHVALLVPVLAALGVVLVTIRLAIAARRRMPVAATWVACGLVVLVAAGYAAGPGRAYAETNADAIASRYRDPAFVRVGTDDLRAADWLAARVRPGERVMNSANDGSTILYVAHGIPVVNVYPLGLPQAPYTYELLRSFNRYPVLPDLRRTLAELDVRWVYVDASAPTIGASGSPEGWAGDGAFVEATGLTGLDGLPGLRREFHSGTVSVYSLDLDAAEPSGAAG